MSELPYMPVTVNDEMAETSDLSNEELGALMRLKWALWKAGGFLDESNLARVARAGSRWGKIAPAVLAKLTIEGGKVSSPSLLSTLCITRERRAKKAKAGEARHAKPDHGLTSNNPLKNHEVGGRSAGVVLQQPASNHNQNKNKNLSSLETTTAAAREGPSIKGVDPPRTKSPLETIREEGAKLLVERTELNPLQASAKISKWLGDLDIGIFGPDVLARFLADVDQFKFTGQAFGDAVEQRIKAYVTERRLGGSLKFGPTRLHNRQRSGTDDV